jgi:hypothetical protein
MVAGWLTVASTRVALHSVLHVAASEASTYSASLGSQCVLALGDRIQKPLRRDASFNAEGGN